jgi:Cu/Ag efflux pump CusA
MNIPLAAIGAVGVIWFTTGVFSIASLMGFITLTGISLRNGIMMINHYIHLMKYEGETFSKEMIIRGSLERLVPVLMTTTCAVLGLIPLAIATGQPGKEILQPMAVVMLSGLVTSTLLDIVYTPAFFWRWCGPQVHRAQFLHFQPDSLRTERSDCSLPPPPTDTAALMACAQIGLITAFRSSTEGV